MGYEATLYTAVENIMRHPAMPGARKVFLTALGGGVFGNEMHWIKDAISKACQKFQSVELEVILVSYGGPTPEFDELVNEWASRDRALSSGGGYEDHEASNL